MLYGGRPESYWVSLLPSACLAKRLMALRALSALGATERLLEVKLDHPVLAWELARSGPVPRDRRLAFFLRARMEREVPTTGPALQRCMAGLRGATHLHTAFAWASRAVELYGERALDGLLEVLLRGRTRHEPCEAAAWALGRLGRPVLGEVRQAFRQASRGTVFWLCQVIWYLGPTAAPLVDLLEQRAPDPVVDAAWLATERCPIWVTTESVAWLAGHLFGFDPQARIVAAAALGGFGPALDQAEELLGFFLNDPDPSLRKAAVASLLALERPVGRRMLPLLNDRFLGGLARQAVLADPDRNQLVRQALQGPDWREALDLLDFVELNPLRDWLELLHSPYDWVRMALVDRMRSLEGAREALGALVQDPMPEIRQMLVGQASLDQLRILAQDGDPGVASLAQQQLLTDGTVEDVEGLLASPSESMLGWLARLERPPETALAALPRIENPRTLVALEKWLTPECEPSLRRALGSAPELARTWAALVSFECCRELFEAQEEPLRYAAALAMERWPERAAEIPTEDPSERVCQALDTCLAAVAHPGLECLPGWVDSPRAGLARIGLHQILARWAEGPPRRAEMEAVARALDHADSEIALLAGQVLRQLPTPGKFQPARDFLGLWDRLEPAAEELTGTVLAWAGSDRAPLVSAALGMINLLWGTVETERLLPAVVPRLPSEEAVRCLAGAPAEKAVPLLVPLLELPEVRSVVLETLAWLGAWEHVEPLWREPRVATLLLASQRLPPDLVSSLRSGEGISPESLLLLHSLVPTEVERSVLADAFRQAAPFDRALLVRGVAGLGTVGLDALVGDPEAADGLAALLGLCTGALEWVLAHLQELPRTPLILRAFGKLLREVGPLRARALVEELRAVVWGEDEGLSEAAVEALGTAGDVEGLAGALSHSASGVRRGAVLALHQQPLAQLATVYEPIRDLDEREDDPQLRSLREMVEATTEEGMLERLRRGLPLGTAGWPSPGRLERLFELGDPIVQQTLAAEVGDPVRTLGLVLAGLASEFPSVRQAFFACLPGPGDAAERVLAMEGAVPGLRVELAHRWSDVRALAAQLLGKAGDQESEEILLRLAGSDPNREVREEAWRALRRVWTHLPASLVEASPELAQIGLERARELWGERPAQEILEAVAPFLTCSSDGLLRSLAVAALGKGPAETVAPVLEPLLADPDLRAQAAEALASVGCWDRLDPNWEEFATLMIRHGHVPEALGGTPPGSETAVRICAAGLGPKALAELLAGAPPEQDELVLLCGVAGLEALWRTGQLDRLKGLLPRARAGVDWMLARDPDLLPELLTGLDPLRRHELAPLLGPETRVTGLLADLPDRQALEALARFDPLWKTVPLREALLPHPQARSLLEELELRGPAGAGGEELAYLITLRPALWCRADAEVQLRVLLHMELPDPELLALGLESPHSEVRHAYSEQLVRQGLFMNEAVPVFLERDRGEMVYKLAPDEVLAALDHPRPEVRLKAVEVLARARDPRARHRLVLMAAEDPSPDLRRAAQQAFPW